MRTLVHHPGAAHVRDDLAHEVVKLHLVHRILLSGRTVWIHLKEGVASGPEQCAPDVGEVQRASAGDGPRFARLAQRDRLEGLGVTESRPSCRRGEHKQH